MTTELDRSDVNASDDDVLNGTVHRTGSDSLNRVNNSLRCIVSELTEDGVLAGEPCGLSGGDEELRTVGARKATGHVGALASVRHSELVLAVEDELGVDLIVEVVAGAAGAGARGVATLDHEVLDDAVEDHTVVKALVCKVFEVLHGLRCVVAEEVDHDITVVGVDGRNRSMNGHVFSLRGGLESSEGKTRFQVGFRFRHDLSPKYRGEYQDARADSV